MALDSILSDISMRVKVFLEQIQDHNLACYLSEGGHAQIEEVLRSIEAIRCHSFKPVTLTGLEGDDEDISDDEQMMKRLHSLHDLEDFLEEILVPARFQNTKQRTPPGKKFKPMSCFQSLQLNATSNDRDRDLATEFHGFMEDLGKLIVVLRDGNSSPWGKLTDKPFMVHDTQHTLTVGDKQIFGRDIDRDKIVRMLLEHSDDIEGNVSIIFISGEQGIGKTTLAKLVFDDDRIRRHFDIKGWSPFSNWWTLEKLKVKVHKSLTRGESHRLNKMTLEEVVYDKKFLLILDDVGKMYPPSLNESLIGDIMLFLHYGKRGSKVIVTSIGSPTWSTSNKTYSYDNYELGVLRQKMSWKLFETLSFKLRQKKNNPEFEMIGKRILRKCKLHAPLAAMSIAGLLFFKDTEMEWKNFKDRIFEVLSKSSYLTTMLVLRLSYNHLSSQLKQCFAYCSLFPEDYEFNKIDLICQWMAQGFLGSSENSMDIGHRYFMELIKRSFLQYDGTDEYREITKCKVHNLLTELALDVGRDKRLLSHDSTQHFSVDSRHLNFHFDSSRDALYSTTYSKKLRFFLLPDDHNKPYLQNMSQNLNEILSNLRWLRALDLANVSCDSLLSVIGELKHLRYLRLGGILKSLPDSIAKLPYLQTLNLKACSGLKELPQEFRQLTSLICLQVKGVSDNWIDMPPLGQLKSLQALDVFILGKNNWLDELANLNKLTGKLDIYFNKHDDGQRIQATRTEQGGILKDTKLTQLVLKWPPSYLNYDPNHYNEEQDLSIMESLQPPPTLKVLEISRWMGAKFPIWWTRELPHSLFSLAFVEIKGCKRCTHLPSVSLLPHLKALKLQDLESLEYIQEDVHIPDGASDQTPFFPSLEHLKLWNLPKLKGWSRAYDVDSDTQFSLRLNRCFQLTILDCLSLITMPFMPRLKSLTVHNIHFKLLKHFMNQHLCQHILPSHY